MDNVLKHDRMETVMGLINDRDYRPMKFREMCGILNVPKDERNDLKGILDELIGIGKIVLDDCNRYLPGPDNTFVGIYSKTSRGFGFVTVEGMDEDIFISEKNSRGALNKDTVRIKILEEMTGKRREGIVVAVMERATNIVVGTYRKSKNFGFVIPDDVKFGADIFISKEKSKGAVTGHKVVAEITDYGQKNKKPEGKIIEIIGHINDPGVDIMSIVKAAGIPCEFPQEVMEQVEGIPDEVLPEELEGREDIRHLMTVTIDGEDAKDLDDAVTLSKEGGNYLLGVHIADVTHYVTENSPLDKEAIKRGTSVYLVDRVIPQLPHKLSNGICSLNQGCDRLTLSCFMTIDKKGNIIDHRISKTVINSDRRMTYTDVAKIIVDKDPEMCKKYEGFVDMFNLMKEVADILRVRRKKRGSIDFDFPETKILLDEKGVPVEIKPYEITDANRLIEDFMLAANETIAEDFFWREVPFVYRTHETPDVEKIQKLSAFINNFGYAIKGASEDIHPKEIQQLMIKIAGTDEEPLISRLALRSMKQAKYTVKNEGHFGLATKYYCHFTSPIRRYPDLQIHRIIKEALDNKLNDRRIGHYERILPEIANQSSLNERRADEAEREVEKLKKVQYMKKFINHEFEGIISGVTSWGMYVELPNTVEGMVSMTSLRDDYYYFDEEKYQLVGEHTHKTYSLGQPVRIAVMNADMTTRTIDFEIVEVE